MNTQLIEEAKLIASFMGFEIKNDKIAYLNGVSYGISSLDYHKDWYKLIPVVEKIESLGYEFRIYTDEVEILELANSQYILESITGSTKLRATYNGCLQFIKISKYEFEILDFLEQEWKCRWITDKDNEDNLLLIAPESLNTALTSEFGDSKTHSDYKAIDNQICYYASEEEMLLSDEELFNLIYN